MAGIYEGPGYALDAGGWALEETDESVVFTPSDIDAALIVSSMTKADGVIGQDELKQMSFRASPAITLREPVECGEFWGFRTEYEDDEASHWRIYWLANGNRHLYITYNCHTDYAGRHDAVVDWMLGTLRAHKSAA